MLLCVPQVLLAPLLSMLLAQAEGKEFGGEGNSMLGWRKALGLKGLEGGEAGATGGLKEGRLAGYLTADEGESILKSNQVV